MDAQLFKKLDYFFVKFNRLNYSKSTILLRAGEEPKGIFYLKRGNVRQYAITQNGEEMTLNLYKPGAFFPMAQAVNKSSNRYFFEAINEVEVYEAPKETVVAFLKKEPDVLFNLVQRLFSGLDGMLTHMEHLMSGNATARLIAVLALSAKRFGLPLNNGVVINLKLTHQDLASLAGLSRETVSREMMYLKDQKLIVYTNSAITIYDLQKLEQALITE